MTLQSLGDIQDTVRSAATARSDLRITGGGTWESALRSFSPAPELSLANYRGVVEYVPGNLTITVRGGTTLEEIAEVTAEQNQWLPLDPYGSIKGTIGATIATCSFGPLVTGFGTPRDLVLGVEAVVGTGELVRAGGKVVKNVAGYDLSRLLTGSWGILGAITEVTLRLFAKQEAETSIALLVPDDPGAAVKLLSGIRAAPIFPWAMELVDARIPSARGTLGNHLIAFRFGGNANVVQSQIRTIQSLGETVPIEHAFWTGLRTTPHSWSLRISSLPSRIVEMWEAAAKFMDNVGDGVRVGTPERGMVRLLFSSDADSARLNAAFEQLISTLRSTETRLVVEAMPSHSPLTQFAPDTTSANELSAGIKRVFDPGRVFNSSNLMQ